MIDTVTEQIPPAELALPIVVALIAFLVRYAVSRRWVNVLSFFIDIFAAVFAGLMASFIIDDYEIAERTKWFIVALTAMVGPDLLLGIIHTSNLFSKSPVTFTLRIIRIVLKKPLTKEEIEEMMQWEKELRKEGTDKKGEK